MLGTEILEADTPEKRSEKVNAFVGVKKTFRPSVLDLRVANHPNDAVETFIRKEFLNASLEKLSSSINFYFAETLPTVPKLQSALPDMMRGVVELLDVLFPEAAKADVSKGGALIQSQPAQPAFRVLDANASHELIKSLSKVLLDEQCSETFVKWGKDIIIKVVVMTLQHTLKKNYKDDNNQAIAAESLREFYDCIAAATKHFCENQWELKERVSARRSPSKTVVDKAVTDRENTLVNAHISLLDMLNSYKAGLWENARNWVQEGKAPYLRGLFWSLAILPDANNEKKDLAAEMLANLGFLCMDSEPEQDGFKTSLRVFLDEGVPRTSELWGMLSRHGGVKDPKAYNKENDKAVFSIIALSLVIVGTGKYVYKTCVQKDARLCRGVQSQSDKILECLLSRVPLYQAGELMQYIIVTLAITVYHSFIFFLNKENILDCNPLLELVLNASHALSKRKSLLFRSLSSAIYILFNASCSVLAPKYLGKDRGMDASRHDNMLCSAFEFLYDVCKSPPKDILGSEWGLKREMRFTKVACTISDNDPRTLGSQYRSDMIPVYWVLTDSLLYFFGRCGINKSLDKPHGSKDELIEYLTEAFEKSCKHYLQLQQEYPWTEEQKHERLYEFEAPLRRWIEYVPHFTKPYRVRLLMSLSERRIKEYIFAPFYRRAYFRRSAWTVVSWDHPT